MENGIGGLSRGRWEEKGTIMSKDNGIPQLRVGAYKIAVIVFVVFAKCLILKSVEMEWYFLQGGSRSRWIDLIE